MAVDEREIEWERDSREAVRRFPTGVKWIFGRALYRAQLGKRHRSASPMKGRLRGVVELRSDEEGDTYRPYYTLKCPGYVLVLYGHKKESKRGSSTPKHEEELIVQRLKDAMAWCREGQEMTQ